MRICPKQIMCAIDFSGFAPLILSYGKALAREFGSDITLCHIVQDTVLLSSHAQAGFSSEEVTARRLEDAQEAMGYLIRDADIQAKSLVTLGHPADEITRLTREKNIDLVIAATHGGSGIKRFLVGSVTDRLIKTLECPLLVLHPQDKSTEQADQDQRVNLPIQKVLVGCDFSEGSELAFNYALSLAQEFEAELHLVHVIKPHTQVELEAARYVEFRAVDFQGIRDSTEPGHPVPQRQLMDRMEEKLSLMIPKESRHWCTPVISLRHGEPYLELLDYAKANDIDMIILGIHGHSLLEQFLVGSTTDRVISRADCPVMAVRQRSEPENEKS